MTQTSNIETNRLVFCPSSESDIPDVFESCKNLDLDNNAGRRPHETIEEIIDIPNTVSIGEEEAWVVVSKETKQVTGSIGTTPGPRREDPHVRMLGYWLDKKYWGQGLMSEAVKSVLNYRFIQMDLHLIMVSCYPHNQRSQRILRRNGFIYEGLLHQAELIYNG